jgi:hypothetical protein
MKLYIDHYDLSQALSKKKCFDTLFHVKKRNLIEIYSKEGIFQIDETNIIKMNYLDKPIVRVPYFLQKIDILVDKSITETSLVKQIPFDHISIQTEKYEYSLKEISTIKCVFILTSEEQTMYDFYFDVPDDTDIHNPFFQKEINVFLFQLN